MAFNYDRQPDDVRYRIVNLKVWDRENAWMEFTNDHIESQARYCLLEVKHKDGKTELCNTDERKERAYWKLTNDGILTLTFQGENALREGPFLGHIFLTVPGKMKIRYAFPRVQGEKVSNQMKLTYHISAKHLISTLQVEGDRYFNQIFVLERN